LSSAFADNVSLTQNTDRYSLLSNVILFVNI
jgi:hypothetical protein